MTKTFDFPTPDARIEMIEQSLRCFRLGVASLIPLIFAPVTFPLMFSGTDLNSVPRLLGIFFAGVISLLALTLAILASRSYFRARRAAKHHWNPGRRYRIAGETLSSLAVLFSLVLLLISALVYVGVLPT